MEPKLLGTCCECRVNGFDACITYFASTVPLEEMQKRFGEESIWVYNILRVRA